MLAELLLELLERGAALTDALEGEQQARLVLLLVGLLVVVLDLLTLAGLLVGGLGGAISAISSSTGGGGGAGTRRVVALALLRSLLELTLLVLHVGRPADATAVRHASHSRMAG